MRTLLFAPLFALLLAPYLGAAEDAPAPVSGSERRCTLDPPPHGLSRAAFELWVPATVGEGAPARAVIASPLYQADTKIYELPDWRALAERHRAVMLRHDMRATVDGRPNRLPVGRDALDALADALARFADDLGRPELPRLPLVLTGLSQGGMQATRLAALDPGRVAAAVPFHGADLAGLPPDSPALGVPMLIVLGSMDDLTVRILPDLPPLLRRRPPWAVLFQPGVPHPSLGDQEFILLWLDRVLSLRLDDEAPDRLRPLDRAAGWVGRLNYNRRFLVTDADVSPAADAELDADLSWLSDEALARAWRSAVLTGCVTGHEDREEVAARVAPAPENVVVDGRLDEWTDLPLDLTWAAQILPDGLAWHGPADSSARFAVAADERFLYFAFRVDDDDGRYRGLAPWMPDQDGLEIRLDARPAPERMSNSGRGEGADFLLIAVGPGPGPDERFVNAEQALPPGTRVASRTDATGYAVEIAVPSAYLDKAQGGPWTRFRLNVAVNDADADGKNQAWWRADWRTEQAVFGSGTVAR